MYIVSHNIHTNSINNKTFIVKVYIPLRHPNAILFHELLTKVTTNKTISTEWLLYQQGYGPTYSIHRRQSPVPKSETDVLFNPPVSEWGKAICMQTQIREAERKMEELKIHTANLLRLVSISFWSPKSVVWILLTASSFSVSHASKRHWNKIGDKKFQSALSYVYMIHYYISYNVLRNIPIYNLENYLPALLQNAAIYEEYLAEGPIFLLSTYRWLPIVFQSAEEKKRVLHLFTFFLLNKFFMETFSLVKHMPLKYVAYHTEKDFRTIWNKTKLEVIGKARDLNTYCNTNLQTVF